MVSDFVAPNWWKKPGIITLTNVHISTMDTLQFFKVSIVSSWVEMWNNWENSPESLMLFKLLLELFFEVNAVVAVLLCSLINIYKAFSKINICSHILAISTVASLQRKNWKHQRSFSTSHNLRYYMNIFSGFLLDDFVSSAYHIC